MVKDFLLQYATWKFSIHHVFMAFLCTSYGPMECPTCWTNPQELWARTWSLQVRSPCLLAKSCLVQIKFFVGSLVKYFTRPKNVQRSLSLRPSVLWSGADQAAATRLPPIHTDVEHRGSPFALLHLNGVLRGCQGGKTHGKESLFKFPLRLGT